MSTKLIPSSGRRLRVRTASALSRGRPQTRGPVMRIAPKPSRLISMSPPILKDPDLQASIFAILTFPCLANCYEREPGCAQIEQDTPKFIKPAKLGPFFIEIGGAGTLRSPSGFEAFICVRSLNLHRGSTQTT